MQTLHTGAVHEQGDEKAMQRKIDDLKRQLRRAQRKQSLPSSDVSSNDEEDTIYKQQSRTPPNEFFSCEKEHLHKKKTQKSILQGSRN